MSRKIIILSSSPRKNGNTNIAANWCAEGATAAGARVEQIDIARLNYKENGCISCFSCQMVEKYECAVKDDANPIMERLKEFDVLIFATPVYFMGPNAQMKLLLDRMMSLFKFDPETEKFNTDTFGRPMALIATAGGDMNGGLSMLDDNFRAIAGFTKSPYDSLLIPNAPMDPEKLLSNEQVKQKAIAFGQKLAG